MTGGKRKRDFTQTTSACLGFIHEALLKHQWQRAAEYMHSYLQTLEDSDTYKRQAAPEVGARREAAGRSRLLGVLLLALPTEAFCFPCLCFLSPGVGGVHHHARLTPSFHCQDSIVWNTISYIHSSVDSLYASCMCFCMVLALFLFGIY